MHFRILKMFAASGFLAALECTKFVFGRGSAGGAYNAPPDPLTGLTGTLLLRRRREEGRGGKGKKEGTPPRQIPGSAPFGYSAEDHSCLETMEDVMATCGFATNVIFFTKKARDV